MPKVTAEDIKNLGFIAEMVNKTEEEFDDYLTDLIARIALLFEGRIGSTAYNSATSPGMDYVKQAELCLCAEEFLKRVINTILQNVKGNGQEIDVSQERSQKKDYKDEANLWIAKIVSGASSDSDDFAVGSLISSHFGDTDA
jgi:hypothetical protein